MATSPPSSARCRDMGFRRRLKRFACGVATEMHCNGDTPVLPVVVMCAIHRVSVVSVNSILLGSCVSCVVGCGRLQHSCNQLLQASDWLAVISWHGGSRVGSAKGLKWL
mmetsp:Transcript_54237/g.116452  ORF Transcript_54237/g.116452 Transcript_54237/m.116452 type:complete len:109 (+) Transcript_54237:707-1033(+)